MTVRTPNESDTAAFESELLEHDAFSSWLADIFTNEVALFVKEVPRAGLLTDSETPFDERYYVRHRIETVHRIRATAALDARALSLLVPLDYETSCVWGEYAVEEMRHDRLYLSDLARHGVSLDDVLATPRFAATDRLLNAISEHLDTIGPIAVVAYSLFVEWNSERYSAPAVAKAEAALSGNFVRGSKAHLGIDETEDHYQMMVSVAYRLMPELASIELLENWLCTISRLFREYFVELHEATV